MEIIPNEEEVANDAIPLAIKSPKIVDWKIYKEKKKIYYEIIKADGKTKMYMVFSKMLESFDKEDLEDVYNNNNNPRILPYYTTTVRMEAEKSVRSNGVVGEDMVEPNKSYLTWTLKEVDGKGKIENRTNKELAGNTKEELTGEKVRELVETPRSQPVKFYLKHRIDNELIEGLIGNSMFNDSLLAI
nr:hypothetical protein [Tanacetum cinerariifolium]